MTFVGADLKSSEQAFYCERNTYSHLDISL